MNFQTVSLPFQAAGPEPIGKSGFSVGFTDEVTVDYCHFEIIDFHDNCDRQALLLRAARFAEMGVRRADIETVLVISRATLQRAVKKLREHGEASFQLRQKKRGFTAISDEQQAQAEALLATGMPPQTVSLKIGILPQTLHYNIKRGNVVHPGRPRTVSAAARSDVTPDTLPIMFETDGNRGLVDNKTDEQEDCGAHTGEDLVEPLETGSIVPLTAADALMLVGRDTRERRDRAATLGRGATDNAGRLAASIGMLPEVQVQFDEPLSAVAGGGVLTAVPTLLQGGLLRNAKSYLSLPKGDDGLQTTLIFIAFLLMARLRHPNALHYQSPGEWGALLGTDRCPEAKTLRRKIKAIASHVHHLKKWQEHFTKDWIAEAAESCATLSVDGHVKVYTGRKQGHPMLFFATF